MRLGGVSCARCCDPREERVDGARRREAGEGNRGRRGLHGRSESVTYKRTKFRREGNWSQLVAEDRCARARHLLQALLFRGMSDVNVCCEKEDELAKYWVKPSSSFKLDRVCLS